MDFHSTHCDHCINFIQCNKVKNLRKSRGVGEDEDISCPIIPCRLNCGHKFHACKEKEHEYLCGLMRVPCINKEFGCPLIMERFKRGPHLEICPASVIVCTMEWNRWPLPPGKIQPFDMNPEQLDVASKLRDEKTLADWKEFVPPTLRYLLKTGVNDRHPVMPLGLSGLRIPKSILNQAIIEQNLKLETDNSESTESEHDESSDSPWGCQNPPGLQESVCIKLKALNLAQSSSDNQNFQNKNGLKVVDVNSSPMCNGHGDIINGHNKNTTDETNKETLKENGCTVKKRNNNVDLSLMVEVRTRCQRKPDSMYTFMCSREFRRDEFPIHFSHIHSNIHTQTNGWLYTRCPMQQCSFGLERMQPIDENYNIVYNSVADTFCVAQKSHISGSLINSDSHPFNDKTDENPPVSLSSLPFELLVHLTKYLDPLSLNSLSMTNSVFRDACSCVVLDRGIVVFQWEKNSLGLGWEVTEKKWIFSSAFSPIHKWKFGDPGRMINHLKICPFFERNIPSKPFAYPVTKEQL